MVLVASPDLSLKIQFPEGKHCDSMAEGCGFFSTLSDCPVGFLPRLVD